jgi:DNA-binding MarR family transcriptional regulator
MRRAAGGDSYAPLPSEKFIRIQSICIYIYCHVEELHQNLPTFACMCASFRRASRALTQLYDDGLRPAGLRATQFTILQALALTGEISQGELGRILVIDSTTLTRTLEIIERHGWIAKRQGEDKRERWLNLTKAGRSKFERARPYWEEIQTRFRSKLGAEKWGNLLKFADHVTNAVMD